MDHLQLKMVITVIMSGQVFPFFSILKYFKTVNSEDNILLSMRTRISFSG